MPENYKKLFTNIEKLEPPIGLLNRIMLRIDEECRGLARARVFCFGSLSLIALLALIPASKELYSEISESGFLQFTSLLFSDAGALSAYSKDFIFSLVESFPAFGASAVLLSVFAFLFSLRFILRDASKVLRRSNLVKLT